MGEGGQSSALPSSRVTPRRGRSEGRIEKVGNLENFAAGRPNGTGLSSDEDSFRSESPETPGASSPSSREVSISSGYNGSVLRFPLQTRRRGMGQRDDESDGENKELVVPSRCARKLLRSSLLTTFSVILAVMQDQHDCALLSVTVLLCSICYWSYPTYGLRRNIDIAVASFSLVYQVAIRSPELYQSGQYLLFDLYMIIVFAACGCYLAARWSGQVLHNADMACRWHTGLHVLGNLSNAVLYTSLGRIARASRV